MILTRVRSLGSLVALAVVLLVSADAFAANYPLAGKLTNRRGKATNVPNVGNTPCAPLTFNSGPGVPGPVTPTMRTMTMIPANVKNIGDGGCVAGAPGASATGTNASVVGGSFQLPNQALFKPLPGYLQAISITNTAMGIQIGTSNTVTALPTTRFETPGGTMGTGCVGSGVNLVCANHAQFGLFRTGAWSTQTGRGGPAFTWCPPNITAMNGAPCTNIAAAGFGGIVKYNGTANSFGGTMSYVTKAGPNPGSLANTAGAGRAIVLPIGAPVNSNASGRGYADFHSDTLFGGPLHLSYQTMSVYVGPVLGSQMLITNLGFTITSLPNGTNFNWGFPWTTATVLVRNTGTAGGSPHNTTFTARGADTITSMGNRNISLVAGAIGAANIPGVGVVPTSSLTNMLLTLPEPSGASSLFAGAIALFGIAAWRRRSTR